MKKKAILFFLSTCVSCFGVSYLTYAKNSQNDASDKIRIEIDVLKSNTNDNTPKPNVKHQCEPFIPIEKHNQNVTITQLNKEKFLNDPSNVKINKYHKNLPIKNNSIHNNTITHDFKSHNQTHHSNKQKLGIDLDDLDKNIINAIKNITSCSIIQAYKLNFIKESYAIKDAIGAFLPTLKLNNTYEYKPALQNNAIMTYGLQSSVNLFNKGKDRNNLMSIYYSVLTSANKYKSSVQDYITQAIEKYITLQSLYATKLNILSNLNRYKKLMEFAQLQKELNEISTINFTELQIEYENLKIEYDSIKQKILENISEYKTLFENFEYDDFNSTLKLPKYDLTILSNAQNMIAKEHTKRQEALMSLQSIYYEYYNSIADTTVIIPTIDLSIQAASQSQIQEGNWTKPSPINFGATLNFTFPIDNLWKRNSIPSINGKSTMSIKASLAKLQSNLYKFKNTNYKVYQNISNIIVNLQKTKTILDKYTKLIQIDKKRLDSLERRYKNGDFRLIDLIQVINRHQAKLNDYIKFKNDYLKIFYSLVFQTTLLDEILKESPSYFDPFIYLSKYNSLL